MNGTCVSFLLVGVMMLILGDSICQGQAALTTEVQPDSFLPSVTPQVTLKCTVTSSPSTSSVLFIQMKKLISDSSDENTTKATTKEKKAESSKEVLLATVSSQVPPTLNVEDADDYSRMAVSGSIKDLQLILKITLPSSHDAGVYTCHASVLNSDFQLEELSDPANLTIIGEENSFSVLLAKEQTLETHQKHLEEEELALHEELRDVLFTNKQLLHRVFVLENKNANLTSLVEDISQKLYNKTREPPQSYTDDSSDLLTSELAETKSKLESLKNGVISELTSKVIALETTFSTTVTNRLKSLEGKLSALQTGESAAGVNEGGERNSRVNAEIVQKVSEKLTTLEQTTVKEISQKVLQLEQVVLHGLKERLDILEGKTLKEMDAKIANFDVELDGNVQRIGKVESQVKEMQLELDQLKAAGVSSPSKLPPPDMQVVPAPEHTDVQTPQVKLSDKKCFVCGNLTSSKHCSVHELQTNSAQFCPLGVDFCMNDVIQRGHNRFIYRRCVTKEECEQSGVKSAADCGSFNFMSNGFFECHFCCTSQACNENVKPSKDMYQG